MSNLIQWWFWEKIFINKNKLKGFAGEYLDNATQMRKNLTDYATANKLTIKPLVFEKNEAATAAYYSGRCQAYTTDITGLAAERHAAKNPDDQVILPEVISKEPLGAAVRRGDDEFFTIAKWVLFAMIEAEEYGITQANVDEQKKSSTDPNVQRILGTSEDLGSLLGLDKEWAYRAVKAVGNYGETFDRNLGEKSVLKIDRGLNKLWNKGGIMYAPPIR